MHEFEEKVASFCRSRSLFPGNTGVLVALSGGGDSVAMLFSLAALSGRFGLRLEAGHLNHALRGDESDSDEVFCRELCDSLGVPLTVERLAEGELAPGSESLETAARLARRTFLRSLAGRVDCPRIATGHTRDDQAETLLQRLIRGTGPSGLGGISPVSEGRWVRPLLGVNREEARRYLRDRGVAWREDSSNRDEVFFRNRIRHVLIPLLEERFSPAVTDSLVRLSELARAQEEFLEESVREAFRKCCIYKGLDKILLDASAFVGYHITLRQRMVRYCLTALEGEGRDTDLEEVESVLALVAKGRGVLDVTARVRFGVGKGVAVFVARGFGFDPIAVRAAGETEVPSGGRIIARKAMGGERVDGGNAVLVPEDVIRRYGPLTVAPAKTGEYMVPFGMKGTVKVHDIMAAAGIHRVLRDSVPVVRAGAAPVWIPGLRSSELLRIAEPEERALLLVFAGGPRWR